MPRLLSRRQIVTQAAASAVAFNLPAQASRASVLHMVRIHRFEFQPALVTVHVGDRIKWTNLDIAPHTATADAQGWGTQELSKGQSAEILVTEGMELEYFCAFHPHMKGTIEII
ncbi:plastocyanin/azurin family copper-binding protein [Ruegeria lacuscaerulensis]|uniref:plastocyanin/azurin family copper-binding protein n=2 Tax=Ruegeria lacuscaerulensis TaxID=55218 RepID=UPI00147A45BA|nr:plastocyanin/azurin family copper-binding protein [Ruegeria lacuscaerulensis]